MRILRIGANSEGPVGSPSAWKNKRLLPVTVIIPGYNICKISDDASLSYLRELFENRFSALTRFSGCLILGGLTLIPYGLPGPNGDTNLLI